ncbi:MAG: YciI family protein [Gemmatimonadota bacterium]
MRVMVIVKANADSEAGKLPSERLLREMGSFNEELVNAGLLVAGEGLKPSAEGVRIRTGSGGPRVIDGPFAETKELIAGFWIWQVKSMDEAVEWAKRIPNLDGEEGEFELRPIFTDEDFAPSDPTGEIREAEGRMRERLEAQQ